MEETEYLAIRLQNQIDWYSHRSAWCQKWYKRFKIANHALVLIMVPLNYLQDLAWWLKMEQIKHASVVIVCVGIHVSHSEWILFEIETALQIKKPILAVKPYENSELPSIITTNHDKIRTINWRASSVIAAVESLLK